MKSKQITHEEELFHNLFMEYYPSLLSFARYYVKDETIAEDLVQDVFVKNGRVWKTFRLIFIRWYVSGALIICEVKN